MASLCASALHKDVLPVPGGPCKRIKWFEDTKCVLTPASAKARADAAYDKRCCLMLEEEVDEEVEWEGQMRLEGTAEPSQKLRRGAARLLRGWKAGPVGAGTEEGEEEALAEEGGGSRCCSV